jgi:hypothetical protein
MGKEALQRLHSFLADAPVSAAETAPWPPERSPFERSAQPSEHRNSTPVSAVDDGLTDYPREDQVEQLEQSAAKPEVSSEESVVKETTNTTDTAAADDAGQVGQRAGVAAFQAALVEAQGKAEGQLRAALDRVRQEEAERYNAEISRVREELERQHADDLQSARSAALDSIKALTGSIVANA